MFLQSHTVAEHLWLVSNVLVHMDVLEQVFNEPKFEFFFKPGLTLVGGEEGVSMQFLRNHTAVYLTFSAGH